MTDIVEPNPLLQRIAVSTDKAWLETCRKHNAQLGNTEVAEAAADRLLEVEMQEALARRPQANTVEARVQESLRVYRELLRRKHGRRQSAGYTERDIRNLGEREALIATIRRGKRTDGLLTLQQYGRLDCAYEQIAIDFAHEMPPDVVTKAKATLATLGSGASKDGSA